MAERLWNPADPDLIPVVFGSYDSNLNLIQKRFPSPRGIRCGGA